MGELASRWLTEKGPEQEIVLSSRIRLARNLSTLPFPQVADDEQLAEVAQRVKEASNLIGSWGSLEFRALSEIDPLEQQLLLAKHLISPQLVQKSANRALLLSSKEDISVMVNEEDHLRLQVLLPGLDLEEGWELIDELDNGLEERLDFAFSSEHGYLTACPTNVGTGIRASVMVHLPALSIVKQVQQLFKGVTQVGLIVRGLYGEGTEASGHIYQLSNQVTLGRTEQEIIENINSVTKQIIQQEQQARKVLLSNAKAQIEDRVYRAYGILTQARLLTTEEAMNLLSDLRLGIGLGLLTKVPVTKLNQLTVLAQPQAVQGIMKQQLPDQQRDYYRAALIREKLKDK